MKSFKQLNNEKYLVADHTLSKGGMGVIKINGWRGSVIWSRDDGNWEHVSVSPDDPNLIPSWEDMCTIKDIFWGDEEDVIQFFPKKSEYVNLVNNCMHLWRPRDPETQRRLEM